MIPKVSVVMGSESDWKTLKHASKMLDEFKIAHEVKVVSAHRTPDFLVAFSESLRKRGVQLVIAGAGGAAHLPGMLAAKTSLPVLGVPVESKSLKGLDSLLSISQMPKGVPVGTLAIGEAGAVNAALLAISILALQDRALAKRWDEFREKQTQKILKLKSPKKIKL